MTNEELLGSISELLDHKLNVHSEAMNARFEAMNDSMDARFEAMNASMDARFEVMNASIDERFEAMNTSLDEKLKPINERLTRIELLQENAILPRLQNIEACYTSTYERYQNSVDGYEKMKQDIVILKQVVTEHGKWIQSIS